MQHLLALRELGRMLQTLDAPADGTADAGSVDAHGTAPTPSPASALAIDTALSRLQAGDLCLVLVDQVEEALAHLSARCAAPASS